MVKVKLGDLTWGQIVGDNYQPSTIKYVGINENFVLEKKSPLCM
jgi:hypothetical protein